jgi:hypothetical protein
MKMAGVAKTKDKVDNFEELLRIAKKVNFKLKGSIVDIDKDIEETKLLIANLGNLSLNITNRQLKGCKLSVTNFCSQKPSKPEQLSRQLNHRL